MTAAVSTTDRPIVVQLALRARVLASIRGGLSLLAGAAAVLVGAPGETVLLGWTVGAMLVSIVLAGDPRGRRTTDPVPLPGAAITASSADIARTDVFPSTVGVATLALVALAFSPALAGIMAGILGGMALMTMASWVQVAMLERRLRGVLYVARGSRRLYIRDAHG